MIPVINAFFAIKWSQRISNYRRNGKQEVGWKSVEDFVKFR